MTAINPSQMQQLGELQGSIDEACEGFMQTRVVLETLETGLDRLSLDALTGKPINPEDIRRHELLAHVLRREFDAAAGLLWDVSTTFDKVLDRVDVPAAPLPVATGAGRQAELMAGADEALSLLSIAEAANRAADAAWRESGAPVEDADKFLDHKSLVAQFETLLMKNLVQAGPNRREGFLRGLAMMFCGLSEGGAPGDNFDPISDTEHAFAIQAKPAAKPRRKTASAGHPSRTAMATGTQPAHAIAA